MGYKIDELAFLFSLRRSDKRAYVKFPIKKNTNAIYCNSTYGPTFGGHDLYTFNNNLTAQGASYTLNGSVNFGRSYDMLDMDVDDIDNTIKTVTELEVYGFREISDVPWRHVPELNKQFLDSLKEEMEQFAPPEKLAVSRYNILLLGQVGAGKSSFINTVDSVFKGHITQRAGRGKAEHGVTLRFNPFVPLSPTTPVGIDDKPTIDDIIHCVCFVIDGSTVDTMPDKVVDKIKALQSVIRQKDIPHVVLLTKVDRIIPWIEEDLSSIFESETIERLVETVGNLLGVQRNHILPMKNYESETDLSDEVSALTLINLKKMLMVSGDYISEHCHTMSHDSVDSKVMYT